MDDELRKRIRAARAYAELGQEDMAARLDMSGVTYKRIESGKRELSLAELHRIAEITGMPEDFFSADLAQLANSEQHADELRGLESTIGDLVARLEDIEWRMRKDLDAPDHPTTKRP